MNWHKTEMSSNLTLVTLALFAALSALPAPAPVGMTTASAIAARIAALQWRTAGRSPAVTLSYYDFDGSVSAYACVIPLRPGPFPTAAAVLDSVKIGRTLASSAATPLSRASRPA